MKIKFAKTKSLAKPSQTQNFHMKMLLSGLITGIAALGFTPSAHALHIIAHLTSGPEAFAGFATSISGPAPLLPGSATGLDCKKVKEILGDNMNTTETGVLCLALGNLEAHIKNKVTVNVEFYKVDFAQAPGWGAGVIGGTAPNIQWFVSPENNPNLIANHGYNKMLNLLQSSAAKESDKDPIVSHLPNIGQLNAILPNNPFFKGFKPVSIAVSTAQLKALGMRPAKSFKLISPDYPQDFQSLPGMDAAFALANDTTTAAFKWDLNTTDSIGLTGPYTKEVYNTFRFNNLSTLPPDFFPNWPSPNPNYLDFGFIVQHEVIHVLGQLSNINLGDDSSDIMGSGYPDLPREAQFVFLQDMFRFPENQVDKIKSANDFTKAAREWISEGPGNTCSVDKGNAVFVADVTKNGPEVIKLSSGFAGPGDGRQSSHLRSPFNSVTANPNCKGALIGLNFLDNTPGPTMRPSHGRNNSAHSTNPLTNDDLHVIDLIGWDVDYDGTQKTSMDENPSPDENDSLMSADQAASQMGADVYQTTQQIIETEDE